MAERKVIPAPVAAGGAPESRSIGAVLVGLGWLSAKDAERVAQLQGEKNLRFGEAAIQLGVLTRADVDYALSRQFDFPYLVQGQSRVSEEVVAAYAPFTPEVEALRSLRSQVALRWLEDRSASKALAIISAAPKEGRSFITANLGVTFSQLGERTLLVDADLRNPSLHRLFGLEARTGLSAILAGRMGGEAIQHVPGLRGLAVLPAGAVPPNPAELLARPAFHHLLQDLSNGFDVILIDTPPAGERADAHIIAVRAGAAVIIARKNSARKWRVQGITESVTQGKVSIIGSVLNNF
jgi:receptor protein-tyrosine kinase